MRSRDQEGWKVIHVALYTNDEELLAELIQLGMWSFSYIFEHPLMVPLDSRIETNPSDDSKQSQWPYSTNHRPA